ncbi:MAG: cyclopropane-fatty-acyl-phospholipid synthase family protein [Nocardioides sp.]|nr:cyclopropane-fatty-acyl-phospholipid synthase family protein [Nocardioides sp.]
MSESRTTTDPNVLAEGSTSKVRGVPDAPAYGFRGRVVRTVVGRILGNVPVSAALSDGTVLGTRAPGHPEITVADPRSMFARMGQSPMIGLGESYMAGEWEASDGDDLADVLAPFAARLTELIRPTFYRLRHVVLPRGLSAEENSKDQARVNIHRHYDLSNEMFEQFLDRSLSYSSALFETLDPAPALEDLETAQLRKVDAILDQAGVREGTRVLEIGTGWGTLAIRAAERGAHVTTITISHEQAALAQERVDAAGVTDRVDIALRDYRDQQGEFDAIVSVEMIEAVGEKYWPTYFATIDRLLAPGGKVAIQAILLEHHRMVATRNTYTWIHKYIFPGGLLPSTEAIQGVLAEHTTLRVTRIDQMGTHYAHTLRLWREQFLANWPAIEAQGFDDVFRRMWEFYLAYCEAGFRTGYLQVAQISIQR